MVRLHRSTEHRVYALWACPRAAINGQRPPPAATCEPEAGVGFNLRATHENTLVMRRSVAHFSCRQAPGVAPRCRIELLVDQGGGSAAAHLRARRPCYGASPPAPRVLRIALARDRYQCQYLWLLPGCLPGPSGDRLQKLQNSRPLQRQLPPAKRSALERQRFRLVVRT
jgi:hypothetical protein